MFSIVRQVTITALIVLPVIALADETDRPLRDPTRPLNYGAQSEKRMTLALQAIFTGKGRKEAIINGRIVTEGESIGGVRIVRIEDKQVRYVSDGQSHILRLRPSITTSAGPR